jgi:hypothetical protein
MNNPPVSKNKRHQKMVDFVNDIIEKELLSIELINPIDRVEREWIEENTEWIVRSSVNFTEISITCHNLKWVRENVTKNTVKERKRLTFYKQCYIYPSSLDENYWLRRVTTKQLNLLETDGMVCFGKDRIITKDWVFTDIRVTLPKEDEHIYPYILK